MVRAIIHAGRREEWSVFALSEYQSEVDDRATNEYVGKLFVEIGESIWTSFP